MKRRDVLALTLLACAPAWGGCAQEQPAPAGDGATAGDQIRVVVHKDPG